MAVILITLEVHGGRTLFSGIRILYRDDIITTIEADAFVMKINRIMRDGKCN